MASSSAVSPHVTTLLERARPHTARAHPARRHLLNRAGAAELHGRGAVRLGPPRFAAEKARRASPCQRPSRVPALLHTEARLRPRQASHSPRRAHRALRLSLWRAGGARCHGCTGQPRAALLVSWMRTADRDSCRRPCSRCSRLGRMDKCIDRPEVRQRARRRRPPNSARPNLTGVRVGAHPTGARA
jgi:hypothetical protein